MKEKSEKIDDFVTIGMGFFFFILGFLFHLLTLFDPTSYTSPFFEPGLFVLGIYFYLGGVLVIMIGIGHLQEWTWKESQEPAKGELQGKLGMTRTAKFLEWVECGLVSLTIFFGSMHILIALFFPPRPKWGMYDRNLHILGGLVLLSAEIICILLIIAKIRRKKHWESLVLNYENKFLNRISSTQLRKQVLEQV